MTVTAMEHVLVLSEDLETTRQFYCNVVGLRVGPRPPLEFPGYWLYADGPNACLHLAESEPYLEHATTLGLAASSVPQAGGGAVDHIAFDENDYEAALARIAAGGLTAVRNAVPGGPRQLFIDDPNGVRVEINVKGG
jgi:catechol 2,3-dioxygenase-like lactoylglutathione lyase family enzyme